MSKELAGAASTCPLCGGLADRWSMLGAVRYEGRDFAYAECRVCASAACHPMPDAELLARMYGIDYAAHAGEEGQDDPKEPGRVLDWLLRVPRGLLLDFGCGQGELLKAAQALGWRVAGIEFDAAVARRVRERLGIEVLVAGGETALHSLGQADVLHLGDVIEHLTTPYETLHSLLPLLRPGGLVLAQGPLEAGPSLFTAALALWHRLGRPAPRVMAPYHVLLATVSGQRRFFARLGLEEIEYLVSEVCWPAPARLGARDLARFRLLFLWVLRRASMAWSRLRPDRRGNRYFYAGRQGSDLTTARPGVNGRRGPEGHTRCE